jgi:hypothetical protein
MRTNIVWAPRRHDSIPLKENAIARVERNASRPLSWAAYPLIRRYVRLRDRERERERERIQLDL